MKAIYDPKIIEAKWREYWRKKNLYQPDLRNAKRPFYNLMMFPYPSSEGLHVGNMYAFTGADIHGRFKRMQGCDVFEPIGLDGFGIHSENFALKIGKHPAEQAKISEKRFYDQLCQIGNGFVWDNTLETYDPDYYRFTQWIFVQMFKRGLAYRKRASVNWCPSCKTVLADEQVEGGACERCKNVTERRETEQWFFKITRYADRLLGNLDRIDWPEKIKTAQRNWIGKKEGINITYKVVDTEAEIVCFTTRPDTNFGATFVVLGPEHPLLDSKGQLNLPSSVWGKVEKYVHEAVNRPEVERLAAGRAKTGVFTERYCVNDLNGERMPIYVSDFVLGHVGTGAVVGVPGHDKRDFEFAQKYNLAVKRVVVGSDGDASPITEIDQVQEAEGRMINSEFLDGLDIHEATRKIMDYLEEKGQGKRVVSYHLRDWLISRQRYWGPPIPMIYCSACAQNSKKVGPSDAQRSNLQENTMAGWSPVPEDQLPVLLPDIEDYQPKGDGNSPLENAPEEWLHPDCPECGKKAKRETDVSDTFLDSSWYFLRYPSIGFKNSKIQTSRSKQGSKSRFQDQKELKIENWELEIPWNQEITRRWLPVDAYIGGAEHAVLHLLYSRFVTMALHDWGYLDFSTDGEPFPFLFSHGLIIKDGAKMSKSRGNVVIPDDYIDRFGADALRMYLMFLGPYHQGGDFRDSGMAGMYRFLERVWRLFEKVSSQQSKIESQASRAELVPVLHRTIKRVTNEVAKFKYNTAIAALMEFVNAWEGRGRKTEPKQLTRSDGGKLVKLLAPFAPHLAEEIWERLGNEPSVHLSHWPEYDEAQLVTERVEIPVQVNGKTRAVLTVEAGKAGDEGAVAKLALDHPKVIRCLKTKKPAKQIFVPGKTINFVV